MSGTRYSWREVADRLAERLYHQAHCDRHPGSDQDLENCPSCKDRAAYRVWEAKSGRTHRSPPYTGEVLDVLADARSHRPVSDSPSEEGQRS